MRCTIGFALSALFSVSVYAQFTTTLSEYSPPGGIDTVQIAPSGFPSGISPSNVSSTAAGVWNASTCNKRGGTSFPYFRTSGSADFQISVTWHPGKNPSNPTACGNFNKTTRRIDLYEKANDLSGAERSCGVTSKDYGLNLAHELGHFLGLGHPGYCTNSDAIMGPTLGPNGSLNQNRNALPGDCTQADSLNETATEQDPCLSQPVPPSCLEEPNPDYTPGTPIIIDLGHPGLQLTGLEDSVLFDLDADGEPDRIGWTAPSSLDALLGLDRDGDGTIGDGGELFGDATPLLDGSRAAHGFIALREFDSLELGGNLDGTVDALDAGFALLLLWVDENHNGISEPGELTPVNQSPLAKISIDFRERRKRDRWGNWLRYWSRAWIAKGPNLVPIAAVDVYLVSP